MAEQVGRVRDLSKIRNTAERRANLILDMVEDRAQRIVDSLDEPPPGAAEPDAAMVRAMWEFSPYAEQAPEVFWVVHDAILDQMLPALANQAMPADEKMKALGLIHGRAETMALERVYPHRIKLLMLGITTPENSVKLAERAQRLADQEQRRPMRRQPEQQEAPAY